MITRHNVLTKWAADWRKLSAWKRDLSLVEVEISNQAFPHRAGTCWSYEQRLVVYRGESIHGELYTLLHEFAHAATIGDGHGSLWQAVHADAIHEVTRIPIPSAADNYRILCEAGRDAVASWWKTSGNEMLWKMFGG